MSKTMKGIEPLIAVIILIAVTIVIAVAVVGFIMGWWGAVAAVEMVRIYPDSKLIVREYEANITLHVKNEGTATAVIYKIEIEGMGSTEREIALGPGNETSFDVTIRSTKRFVPGAVYKVIVYTRAGNAYSIVLRAEASS